MYELWTGCPNLGHTTLASILPNPMNIEIETEILVQRTQTSNASNHRESIDNKFID